MDMISTRCRVGKERQSRPSRVLLVALRVKGLKEKGFQSRSATASLLIKNCQCMKEG